MNKKLKKSVGALGFGTLLGFVLNRTGFDDFDQLHQMFRFVDLRLFLTFAGALTLSVIGFLFLKRRCESNPKPWHKGTIPGGILFGLGWALCGACPSVPLVQIGSGRIWAIVTLAGICLGTVGYEVCHRRFFQWDRGSC